MKNNPKKRHRGGLVLNFYGATDKGLKREMNQDVFYTHKFNDNIGFAIVCDGMGGQSAGHVASDMVCNIVAEKLIDSDFENADEKQIGDYIVTAISEANIQVYTKGNVEPGYKGMGTTVVLAVVVNDKAYVANIGDSRVYLLQEKKLHQITKDHSLVQELFEQGKISEEQVTNHPNKNMITRAVGVNLTVEIDYLSVSLGSDAKLLLCSDGLTNMVSDSDIEAVISNNNAEDTCEKLINLANQAGGVDNITVAVIE